MTLGASLLMAAIGAILLFAVTASVAGISLNVVGVILIVAGAIGALFALFTQNRDAGTAGPRGV
jgi:hypothetical protein